MKSRLIRELIFVDPEAPRKGAIVEYGCTRAHSTHQKGKAWRVRATRGRLKGWGTKGAHGQMAVSRQQGMVV